MKFHCGVKFSQGALTHGAGNMSHFPSTIMLALAVQSLFNVLTASFFSISVIQYLISF